MFLNKPCYFSMCIKVLCYAVFILLNFFIIFHPPRTRQTRSAVALVEALKLLLLGQAMVWLIRSLVDMAMAVMEVLVFLDMAGDTVGEMVGEMALGMK